VTNAVRTGATEAEFDRAAPRYDLMVALNPGYHEALRAAAGKLVERLPDRPVDLLDLGCGSGASTRALLDVLGERPVRSLLGIDASGGMLRQAQGKRWPDTVRFREGRAEDVADLVAQPVDGIFAAYLFRNVARRDETVAAVHDVLAPGGTLVVQEYSVAGRLLPTAIFTAVCWLVVIPLALLTSRRTTLYRYLWRSVLAFDSVERFVERLRRAGFVDVTVETVPSGRDSVKAGWQSVAASWQRGILHTVTARRPE
jgi:ubiquinone/menaquinone biosynthesis C-methylase UbiE